MLAGDTRKSMGSVKINTTVRRCRIQWLPVVGSVLRHLELCRGWRVSERPTLMKTVRSNNGLSICSQFRNFSGRVCSAMVSHSCNIS